ncbi:ankyrin repeat [Fusarium sp. NRRL 52700]|nr:ankyrin repeat [Fusarium sp. NRRL 52700]
MTSETAPKPRTHNDYHVGWVCALPTEQTAAIAMLDQKHQSLPKLPNDNNTYTLGSVGQHSVVIACLPKGKIGNVSAATVATSMISTFPSIKFCLMVGIGGGIPPKVRLGDVVVSTPVGAFPGVVQYDLGKAHQGGKFERTGALNSPPNALLAALTMVESEHDLTGSRIPEYLEELQKRWPRLAPKYLRSDSLKDQLFKANYAHINKSNADRTSDGTVSLIDDHEAEESDQEDDCRFCDTSQTMRRKPRDMRVHYGLIASGNENKAWQAHAAAVAAAFAKELLGQVQASDVEREPTAKKILSQIHETVLQTESNIRDVKSKMDRAEDVKILEWLTPLNYGPQQSDNLSQRQEGTGEWLLTSKEFQNWVDNGKTLFCPGFPGAGKTILTSIVIDELTTRFRDDDTVGIAYIYVIDALDELKETDGCRNRFLEEIFKLQAQCDVKLFATSRFIPEITDRFDGSTTIHVRAQDEDVRGFLDGKIAQSGQLLQTHREMIKTEIAKAVDGMFLLAQLHFDSVSTKLTLKQIKAALNSLSSGPRAYDIAYEKSMERIAGQKQSSRELAMQVLSWITCAKRVLTTLELQHALAVEENNTELDNENLYRLEDMVSVCSGLVTVDEESGIIRLVHYTTQEYLDRTRHEWFPIAESEITMACIRYLLFDAFKGKFCTIRDEYDDRLLRNPFYMYASHNWGHHALMASMDGDKVILDFLESPAKLSASVQALMASRPSGWGHIEDISQMATEVPTAAYFGLSKTMLALLEKGHLADSKGVSCWTPLSYAARYGHEEVVRLLLSRDDVDPNSEDTRYQETPLSWAAKNGHATIVKLLLEKDGISADHKDLQMQTPLSMAAINGHTATVRLLLSRNDVDPNSTDHEGMTALCWAAANGQIALVKLLLEKQALSFTAENGHEDVVRLLFNMDTVDANRLRSYGKSTPLDYAVERGHEAVVKLLLTKTRVTWGGSLLGSAASKGYERVLALLVNSDTIPDRQGEDQDAIPQTTDKKDETLHWAAENGQLVLIEALLQNGAAINAHRRREREWGSGGRQYLIEESETALHLAAGNGHSAIVSLLLDHGAGKRQGKTRSVDGTKDGGTKTHTVQVCFTKAE